MHGGSVDNLIFTKKFWTPRNYTVHFPWLKCGCQKCHYQAKSDICGYCLYLPKTLRAVTSQLPANGVCQILSHVHLSLDGNCCFPKWSRSKRCRERITRTKKKAGERIKENYSYHSSPLSPVFSHLLTPQTAKHNFHGFFPKTFPYLQKKLKTFHQYCKRN